MFKNYRIKRAASKGVPIEVSAVAPASILRASKAWSAKEDSTLYSRISDGTAKTIVLKRHSRLNIKTANQMKILPKRECGRW
jgi:hypothetical protein